MWSNGPGWWNGLHRGLKIPRPKGHVGSNPTPGTALSVRTCERSGGISKCRVLLLLVCACVVSCGAPGQNAAENVYDDERSGFHLVYPEGWVVPGDPKQTTCIALPMHGVDELHFDRGLALLTPGDSEPRRRRFEIIQPCITVQMYQVLAPVDDAALLNRIHAAWQEKRSFRMEASPLSAPEELTIQGEPWTKTTWTLRLPMIPMQGDRTAEQHLTLYMEAYLHREGDELFSVQFAAMPEWVEPLRDDVNRIVQSMAVGAASGQHATGD